MIAKDVSSEFRALRINRGENSGIRRNMAVVTNEGIVGRVLRTTANTADVITVMDLMSAVDVVNDRSRARGVMEGLTEEVAQLRFTIRTDDFQPGDNLISSGLGGIFPKGISVGTVVKVNKKQFGISQQVEVKPSADFSKLEEVLVVTHSEGLEPSPMPGVPSSTRAPTGEGADTAARDSAAPATRVAIASLPGLTPGPKKSGKGMVR